MIYVGTVIKSEDSSRAGMLVIKADKELGLVTDDTVTASMASPNVGGGYGFAQIPGVGSRVLFTDLSKNGEDDTPQKYVWFASTTFPIMQTKGRNVLANSTTDPEDFAEPRAEIEALPPEADSGLKTDCGIPNLGSIYGDNNLPQAAVWKAPPGHFLQFSNKVTDFGTHDVATLLMNASGKYIKLDDGPPTEGMDRITISDEMGEFGGNRIEIKTGDPDKPNSILAQCRQDQDYISIQGSQIMAITTGEGAQIRENMATGGIHDIAYTADHTITAETDIVRTSKTGDITEVAEEGDISITSDTGTIDLTAKQVITFTCGDSVIEMTPTGINITSPNITINGTTSISMTAPTGNIVFDAGDVLATSISLVTHKHIGNLGAPTSPPF